MSKVPGTDVPSTETGTIEVAANGLSRRTVLGGAAFVVGLGATAMMTTSASAKTSQKEAMYQDKPKGSSKCSGCVQFEEPKSCKVVDGDISPEGWCQLFTPKG